MKRRSTVCGYEFTCEPSTTPTTKSSSSSSSCLSSTLTKTTSISSRSLSITDKSVIRNYHLLLELVNTETQYYNDLRILVNVYLDNLPKALSYPTRNLIKRNISSILALHSRITASINKVLDDEHLQLDTFTIGPGSAIHKRTIDRCTDKVANSFIDQAPYFDIYNEFCANHPRALSKLSSSSNLPIWHHYERKCFVLSQQFHPQNNKLQLKDYLIKPIQRVCRYPLLLDSLSKTSNHKDSHIDQALHIMKQVAMKADQARLECEQQEKSQLIATRCEGHSNLSSLEINSFGTAKLVGALDVFVHNSKLPLIPPLKVKYLGAFLYERFLVLVKIRKSTIYEPRYWFPLDLWHVTDVPSGDGLMHHSFRLSLHLQHFEFSCCSDSEKHIWMKAIINSISTSRRMWSQDYVNSMSHSNSIKALPTNVAYSLAHRKLTAPVSATAEDVEEQSAQQSQHFRVSAQKRNSLPIATDVDHSPQPQPQSQLPQEFPTPATSFTYNLLPPPETAPSINTTSSTRFVYHNGNPAEPLVLRRSPSAPRAAVDKCMSSILSEEISQARHMAALNLRRPARPRKMHSVHADLNMMANQDPNPSANNTNTIHNSNTANTTKKAEVKRRRSFVYLDTKDGTNNSFGDIFEDSATSSAPGSTHSRHKKTPSRIAEMYGRKRKSSAPTLSNGLNTGGNSETMANLSELSDWSLNVSVDDKLKHRRKLGHSFSSRFSSFGDSIKNFTPGSANSSPLSTPTAIYATEGAPIPPPVQSVAGVRRNSRSFSGLKNTLTLKSSASEQNLAKHKNPNASKLSETEALYIKYLQGDIGPPEESPDEDKQQDKDKDERPAVRRSFTFSHGNTDVSENADVITDTEVDNTITQNRTKQRLSDSSQERGRGQGRVRVQQPRAVSASSAVGAVSNGNAHAHGSNHKRSRSRFSMLMLPRQREREKEREPISELEKDHEGALKGLQLNTDTPQLDLPGDVGRMSPINKFFIFGQSQSDSEGSPDAFKPSSRKSKNRRISPAASLSSAHQHLPVHPLQPPQPHFRGKRTDHSAPALSRTSTEASHAGAPQLPKLVIGEDGGAEWRQRVRQREHEKKAMEEEGGVNDFGPQNEHMTQMTQSNQNNITNPNTPETGTAGETPKSTKQKSSNRSGVSKSSPNLLSRLNSFSSNKSKKSKKGKDSSASTPVSATSENGDEQSNSGTLNRKKSLKAFLTKMNFTRV
ncbi:hypothetical protein E3P89_02958 [Wallemia ichthyophaga]|uniref:DH domain-containing protein n=2 Tax=Wallemia ichthyophaga TaxID=245174 RepID=A0A4T0G7P1_WALIC|nr:Phosphatidylinositol 3,4,5-trisphosphate-dependent Rac exchanger 1 protein [Wallemia ichthyophaga EXF-994]TIA70482.1 hypothetical protein E3P91_03058 [Wallemia ichthyophaga]EOR00695.1 Phosphatidylinositol 3,4,5-trisphosphate-dependent Rac exchanger 1 protein [Wallemia ichthyophaga EXF-994]TIA79793.1 hypothetical protein E3P98_03051 [Wallemia ichthyophaga]TIA97171.1 hypothetical protein E3P95_02938 [Wallemia ichthyophaga]TIA98423.1 hypothetical protein E3P94_02939 [Wallemia ichthyophaga]